ncbi:sodium:solute symporter family transporter [Hyphomicrobium sp.]|jgi:putative solute:sodium symporter small subunit|uniref:sodium:solute symporter family transporter n=1 Tax=Hyphomicrobium sp. TaxID=82 RepID=UPI002BF5E1AD|nr:sodium/substrate symporter small subunit [Hyphomicrobium sp.]HVZ05918.1 sodium/substrate symporter small subunit [Hyphomicrobium sp.]
MSRLGDISGASRPSPRLILLALAVWLVLAIALPLSALTLNFFRLGGLPLGFWITAQGVFVVLAALAFAYAWRAGGEVSGEGPWPSLAFAGEAVGAATLLGFTGFIAALGYDGLALPLGLVAGLTLLTILVAPRFVLYPARSISGFFAFRYGSVAPRRLAMLITAVATVLLLAANLKAGAYALQSLAHIEMSEAVTAVGLSVAAVWLVGSILQIRKAAGIGFLAVLIGLLVTLVALAAHARGWTVPYLTLGAALENHLQLNMTLVTNRLADVDALTPMTSPFLQLSMRNFAGLLLAVAFGVVAAPHLLGRHVSQAVVAPGTAVRRSAFALAAVAVLAASLSPLAVYSRIDFEKALARGIETAAIPQAVARASELGWVKICGARWRDPAAIAAACTKAPEQRGFLRLQDLDFTKDGFVVAAPLIGGVKRHLQYPLLFGIVLAAILVGHALLAGLAEVDTEVRAASLPQRSGLDYRSASLGAGVSVIAVVLACMETIGSGLLLAEGFALLASGLFTPIVLGLHWRHMNSKGAIAAMLVGFGLALVYLLGVHVWPVEMARLSGALSDAGVEALDQFRDLNAAFLAAHDPQAQAVAWSALREQAATVANWGGLKPASIVLLAVPVSFVIAIVISLLFRNRKRTAER